MPPHTVPVEPHSIPAGSTIGIDVKVGGLSVKHPGIVLYTRNRAAVVAHNSKRHGRPVLEPVAGFAEGQIPTLMHTPSSADESQAIVRSTIAELGRQQVWLPWNNCQHFVSRIVTGRDESPAWGTAVLVGFVGMCVVGLLAASEN